MKRQTYAPFIAAIAFAGFCMSSHAGMLVEGATISRIAPIESNTTTYSVLATGGSGPCSNLWIQFPPAASPDIDTHKRVYATLLLAMAQGFRITIWNYSGNVCTGASYVEAYQ